MEFTEEKLKETQEAIQDITNAVEEFAQKFTDAINALAEELRKAGLIS